MTNTIAVFQISTDEDLRFQVDFTGLDLTGRDLLVNVRERGSNLLRVALEAPANLTLVGTGNLTVFYPKGSMAGWARGEYEADILDVAGGSVTRILAVRFTYDHPGSLVYGVRGNEASVIWADNQAVVTAIGGVGPPGPANVLTIGTVTALETGEDATASLTGTAPTQALNLGLPKGDTGATGPAGTITVGDVETGAPGSAADVENVGTAQAAVLNFTIPEGAKGETGDKGWSPQFAIVADGARRVQRVVGWAGGEGTAPATGSYVGATGLVVAIADAIDIRGPAGAAVGPGSIGADELADEAVAFVKIDPAAVADEPAAEAGMADDLLMTPLGVAQHVTARIGETPGALVALDGDGKLPAVDASQLVNVSPDGAVLWGAAQSLSELQRQQARDNVGVRPYVVGEHVRGSFTALPARMLWPNGQNVSRTTYEALMLATTIAGTVSLTSGQAAAQITVLEAEAGRMLRPGLPIEGSGIQAGSTITAATLASGLTYNITLSATATATGLNAARLFPNGNGNGSTTFGVVDLRDRAGVGRGNMGGSAVGRLTSGNAGFDSSRLGAAGGDERMHGHVHGLGIPTAGHVLVPTGSGVYAAQTDGLTYSSSTGTAGAGTAQNVQPSIVENVAIYAGV